MSSKAKTHKEKYDEIVDGWTNWIWKNPIIEKLAAIRAAICSKCDSNVANICKECGCPLWAKTRSMKTKGCDLKKWGPYKAEGG